MRGIKKMKMAILFVDKCLTHVKQKTFNIIKSTFKGSDF